MNGTEMMVVIARCYNVPGMGYSPYNIIHADDVLWLVFRVVDDRRTCLHPHPVAVFREEPIVATDRRPFVNHCNKT